MSNAGSTTCKGDDGFIMKFDGVSGNIRFAVKDTLDVKGVPTCSGSKIFAGAQPAAEHANVVAQLLNAGFSLQGKTSLHELAFGVTGINLWGGTPVNPKYPKLIPGGSSSGSATVVANQLVDFSVGTDTGGSVRMPAACCGVIGLKPTFDSVSRQGVSPEITSLDCVGFFSRDLAMMNSVLEGLSFPPARAETSAIPAFISGYAQSDIELQVKQFITGRCAFTEAESDYFEAAHAAGLTIISQENWMSYSHLSSHPDLSVDVKTRLLQGGKIDDMQRAEAEKVRECLTRELDLLLDRHQFIMLPALPELPPTLDEASDPLKVVNLTRLLRPFNVSGHPALVIPAGEIAGRPVSLQIIAHKNNELGLISFAGKLN